MVRKNIYIYVFASYLGGCLNTQPYQIPVHSGEGRGPLNILSIIPLLSDFCDNGNTNYSKYSETHKHGLEYF